MGSTLQAVSDLKVLKTILTLKLMLVFPITFMPLKWAIINV